MFPEEVLHCVEWGRDLFGKWFTEQPKTLNRIIEEKQLPSSSQELKSLRTALKVLRKLSINFEECVENARKKFEKLFKNDIKQLLHVYPLDTKTKEGTFFWSLPKRPPHEIDFDPQNPLHQSFILAFSCLKA